MGSDDEHALPAIKVPYLIFLGNAENRLSAKTGCGIVEWRRPLCIGQLGLNACKADLGLPDMTVAQAAANGAKSLLVGIAPTGGQIQVDWMPVFLEAISAGLDIVAGLHARLNTVPQLVDAAQKRGVSLIDVRVPPEKLPVGTGRKRTGKRLLTVGTDCAVGKKYTALAIEREMRARDLPATFRATGQTGILIASRGLPMDAVVSDFLSGAAELLSPDNEASHWDIIEGQGSLFHPGFASVSLGLLHGSQPDAIVVCHDATRMTIDEYEGYRTPGIPECIRRNIELGALTNPRIRCVGVSLNTSGLATSLRAKFLRALNDETGLPCADPLIDGVGPIIDVLQEEF